MDGREWELGIIACLLRNSQYIRNYSEILLEKHFADPLTPKYIKILKACYKKHMRLPTLPEFRHLVQAVANKENQTTEMVRKMLHDAKEIYMMEVSDITREHLEQFIFERVMLEIREKIPDADPAKRMEFITEVRTRMDGIARMGGSYESKGTFILDPEVIRATFQEIQNVDMSGYRTTGFKRLDTLIGGFGPGEFSVYAGATNRGKAQPLNAQVLTPTGFVSMGSLQVGQYVLDKDGRASKVLGVFPQGVKDVYQVNFSDGTSTRCCKEHLWLFKRYDKPTYRVQELQQFWGRLTGKNNRKLYQVPAVEPVQFEQVCELPVDPYVLGVLLGNGSLTNTGAIFTTGSEELASIVKARLPKNLQLLRRLYGENKVPSYRISYNKRIRDNPFVLALRALGLKGCTASTKFIPEIYLHASVENRLLLLQGLMDTDGFSDGPSMDYSSASLALIEGVEFLARSLGGSATRRATRYVTIQSQDNKPYYRMGFKINICPFLLSTKASKWRAPHRTCDKLIESVDYVGQEKCQCISVDSPSSTYVTDGFTVTHNTALMIASGAANIEAGFRVLHISLDEPEWAVKKRYLQNFTGIPKKALVSEEQYVSAVERLANYHYNMILWSEPNETITTLDIESYVERKQEELYYIDINKGLRPPETAGKIELIIVDYATKTKAWMSRTKSSDQSWDRIRYCSEEHQNLARKLNIPVLSAFQGAKEMAQNEIGQLTSVAMGYSGNQALTNCLIIGQLQEDLHMDPMPLWIYGAKTRCEEGLFLVPILYDKSRQRCWDDETRDVDYISSTISKKAKPMNYSSDKAKAERKRDTPPSSQELNENPDYQATDADTRTWKTAEEARDSWKQKQRGMAMAMED